MNENKGKFISFEGIDNCGKGTQIKFVLNYLRSKGINIGVEREPGGTPYGEVNRAILKNPKEVFAAVFDKFKEFDDYPNFKQLLDFTQKSDYACHRTPLCEFFYLLASRTEFCVNIKERLDKGESIIADRFADSSAAYQGSGGNLGIALTKQLNDIAVQGLWPIKTFFIDIPIDEMFSRLAKESPERQDGYFEKYYNRDFFGRVRDGYIELAEKESERLIKINGMRKPEEVFEEIKIHLDKIFSIN